MPLLHLPADPWGLMQDGPSGPFLSQFSRKLGCLTWHPWMSFWEPVNPWNHMQNAVGMCTYPCAQGEGLSLHLTLRRLHPGQAQ